MIRKATIKPAVPQVAVGNLYHSWSAAWWLAGWVWDAMTVVVFSLNHQCVGTCCSFCEIIAFCGIRFGLGSAFYGWSFMRFVFTLFWKQLSWVRGHYQGFCLWVSLARWDVRRRQTARGVPPCVGTRVPFVSGQKRNARTADGTKHHVSPFSNILFSPDSSGSCTFLPFPKSWLLHLVASCPRSTNHDNWRVICARYLKMVPDFVHFILYETYLLSPRESIRSFLKELLSFVF